MRVVLAKDALTTALAVRVVTTPFRDRMHRVEGKDEGGMSKSILRFGIIHFDLPTSRIRRMWDLQGTGEVLGGFVDQ